MSLDDREALDALERKIATVLPEEYQTSYEALQPVPMRSAGLKYDADGNVAWDEIWQTFCDLAMAGGPPHKGRLLEPGTPAAIDAEPERYAAVVDEIYRGIVLATGLTTHTSPDRGWVRIGCFSETMAAWLLRAIATENVACRGEGITLDLPAAPHFRLDKEIKNVVTVIAKTSHYWMGHMPATQRRAIAELFAQMERESPLVQPRRSATGEPGDEERAAYAGMADAIARDTGLRAAEHRYTGWLGLECASARAAIWMMRALVVSNVLSRREEAILYVPIDPLADPHGRVVARTLARVHRLAAARGVR